MIGNDSQAIGAIGSGADDPGDQTLKVGGHFTPSWDPSEFGG